MTQSSATGLSPSLRVKVRSAVPEDGGSSVPSARAKKNGLGNDQIYPLNLSRANVRRQTLSLCSRLSTPKAPPRVHCAMCTCMHTARTIFIPEQTRPGRLGVARRDQRIAHLTIMYPAGHRAMRRAGPARCHRDPGSCGTRALPLHLPPSGQSWQARGSEPSAPSGDRTARGAARAARAGRGGE